MRRRLFVTLIAMLAVAATFYLNLQRVHAGQEPDASGYQVLEPIRQGSLTVFPVVTSKSYPTGQFLTLDEGLRSGEVNRRYCAFLSAPSTACCFRAASCAKVSGRTLVG